MAIRFQFQGSKGRFETTGSFLSVATHFCSFTGERWVGKSLVRFRYNPTSKESKKGLKDYKKRRERSRLASFLVHILCPQCHSRSVYAFGFYAFWPLPFMWLFGFWLLCGNHGRKPICQTTSCKALKDGRSSLVCFSARLT